MIKEKNVRIEDQTILAVEHSHVRHSPSIDLLCAQVGLVLAAGQTKIRDLGLS